MAYNMQATSWVAGSSQKQTLLKPRRFWLVPCM
jgi:hypothetical protein